ncbi:MAG: type II secretion system protein [Verrucomicrobiota bacterium]
MTALSKKSGFTLTELLVALAILGFLTAIATARLGGSFDQAREQSAKRNAQQIASVSSNAIAAGCQELIDAENEEQAVARLLAGFYGSDLFSDIYFKVSLAPEEAEKAKQYLAFIGGQLEYDAAR